MTATLRYADEPAGKSQTATVLRIYSRAEATPTSAPSIRNDVHDFFEAGRDITHVAAMRGNCVFLLARDRRGWSDSRGKDVEILEITEP